MGSLGWRSARSCACSWTRVPSARVAAGVSAAVGWLARIACAAPNLVGATDVPIGVGLRELSIPDLRFCGTSCDGGLVVYGLQ